MIDPMATGNNPQQFSDAELTRLLARAPAVEVPADFATRVRSALPANAVATSMKSRAGDASMHSAPQKRYGIAQRVAMICAVIIAAALFALAPHARASISSYVFWMELLLLAELGGIAYWLTVKRGFAQ